MSELAAVHLRVLKFTSRFTSGGKRAQVVEAFKYGCCYWFAAVLMERFAELQPTLVYDEIANHFGTQICDRVYDISGDVTDQYQWSPWEMVADELHRERIIRDCIMFGDEML